MLSNIMFIVNSIFSIAVYILLGKIYLGKKKEILINLSEYIFWIFLLCFYECIVITFILALFGSYSLLLLGILLFIKNVFLIIYSFMHRIYWNNVKFYYEINYIVLLILIVCAFLYFGFPTEYLWGRRDPIMYAIKGIGIAKTGGVIPESNTFLNANYEEIKGFVNLTYRGIYSDFENGFSNLPGSINFQFLDFFPALLAIGYSIAGLNGLFYVSGIIGIFCLLSIYYFTKSFFDKRTATIAVLFMAFTPAQLWAARITQTELLYQLSWIIGVYIFGVAWKNSSKILMLLSGSIIGFIGLNRIDSYILGIGILAILLYCNLFLIKRSYLVFYLALSYFVTSAISFVYSYCFSYYYIVDHWNSKTLQLLIYANLLMVFLCLITIIIKKRIADKIVRLNVIVWLCENKKGRFLTCWSLFWISRFLFYARPLRQKGENRDWDLSQRSFREFCWYTSTFAILFSIFGLYYLMKDTSKRRALFCFLATGMSNLIVYIWRPSIADDHLWTSRRWISVCIPFVFIISAYGIVKIADLIQSKKKNLILFVSTISITMFLIYQCRLFIFTPMLNEMQSQYEDLSHNMDDENVYYAQMSHFASVLRFVYDKNVFLLNEDCTEEIQKYLAQTKKEIYFIGDIDIFNNEISYEKLYDSEIMGTYILQTKGEYPTELSKTGAITNIYKLYAN